MTEITDKALEAAVEKIMGVFVIPGICREVCVHRPCRCAEALARAALASAQPVTLHEVRAPAEIVELVEQFRDAWRECIEVSDGEAMMREGWDGSDSHIAGFDKVMDFIAPQLIADEEQTS